MKPQTNYEHICNLAILDMATFLQCIRLNCEYGCDAQDLWYVNHCDESCFDNCLCAIYEWLQAEH